MLDESARHNPNEPSFHFHYASSLGKAGQYEESEKHFLLALEKSGSDSEGVSSYHANLGILLSHLQQILVIFTHLQWCNELLCISKMSCMGWKNLA